MAALFAQARERALPGVLRQRLAAARALYSEKRYDASAEAFTGVLLLLRGSGDGQGRRLRSPVDDRAGDRVPRSVARRRRAGPRRRRPSGAPRRSRRRLPRRRRARPTARPPPRRRRPRLRARAGSGPAASSASETPATSAATEPPAPTPARPTSCRRWPSRRRIPRATDVTVPLGGPQTILLDIVIDETGRVERAEVRRSVNRLYEAQLVAATRGWRYTPATQARPAGEVPAHPRSHAQPPLDEAATRCAACGRGACGPAGRPIHATMNGSPRLPRPVRVCPRETLSS